MGKSKQILFVDDDLNILHGLRRMLHKHQNTWKPIYTASGKQALDILRKTPIDIIITDMRMPEMNGISLLKHVRVKYPGIVRVALSGQSELDISLKASVLAHQFLVKPCPQDTLIQVIQQSCDLSDMINQPELRMIVARMKTVPSLPSMYIRLTELLEDQDSSIEDIGKVIESDIGMSAKVLQLVNSAYFGLSSHISSPSHAAALLGIDTLRSLILSVHIFNQFVPADLPVSWRNRLWKHSMGSAASARAILQYMSSEKRIIDYGYIAGLLHDIGIVILSHNFSHQYLQVLQRAAQKKEEIHQAEQRVFQVTHMEIGAYLLGIWGFPSPVIEAVRYHHNPSRAPNPASQVLTAVHLADYFEMQIRGSWEKVSLPHLDETHIKQSIDGSQINNLFGEVEALLSEVPNE